METIRCNIDTTGPSRMTSHWAGGKDRLGNECPWASARAYAREHGAAGVLRANGTYRLYYVDGGRLRQKTWAWSRCEGEGAAL